MVQTETQSQSRKLISSSLAGSVISKSLARFDVADFIEDLVPFTAHDLAELFVEASMLKSTLQWEAKDKTSTATLVRLLQTLSAYLQIEDEDIYREFLREAMSAMDSAVRRQTADGQPVSEAMYRAFDQMDEILGIEYSLDKGMRTDPNQSERLYEGAGLGVQTSYSSILLALDRAQVKTGSKVLDLGSGYGRVGFVIGLLRPDIQFTGYEYVEHRVSDSKSVAAHAGITNAEFIAQDLAQTDFQIPKADVYYMYDPFSRQTYGYVLNQLLEMGKTSELTIVTKGRANTWVKEALESHAWSIDETCDNGTVSLFRSPR